MPVAVQYTLMVIAFPAAWWLLASTRPRTGHRRELPLRLDSMFRALAALALLLSTIFGWMFSTRGDAEPPSWRDDSLDDWRADRDAEREAEREERARRHRDS